MAALFFTAFILGLSGAMMPGPLLTYVINGSLRSGFKAGPLIIIGHSILELILIILIFVGLRDLFSNPVFTSIVGISGGSVLLWMGYDMVKASLKKEISIEKEKNRKEKVSGYIIPGAIISISNPYWILWWATVGITYLTRSYQHGISGTGIFYIGHISADFAWYGLIAGVMSMGKKYINDKIYNGLVAFFGIALIYFAGTFIYDGIIYFI
ncbi:MAG: LysE family transporter [Bacillota bacterium]